MKKSILLSTLLFLLAFLNAQVKTLELNSTLFGSYDYLARDEIVLKPGFSYIAAPGYTFKASIDETLILDVDYQTPIDPDNRSISTSLPVGSTNGMFDVLANGAASYAIPIHMPPGTAGMMPQLQITYNSNGGDGLLGLGWNISGFSSITRCSQNFYYDSKTDGVDFETDDRFELDGNRLVLISGTYGSSGSVYYGSNEMFSKVTANGSAG
jgi:hypothetical protein